MRTLLLLSSLVAAACSKTAQEPPPAPPPPPAAKAPIRGAVGDANLRVMLSELASAKACAMIEGQYRGLRAPDNRGLVTGVLWIRDCEIENQGTSVTFHLAGSGWQWTNQTKKKAGGTFVVKEYVKFGMKTDIHGALDMAYEPSTHVVSMYFSPSSAPEVTFKPDADLAVNKRGTWSTLVGTLGGAFGSSPEEQAQGEAKKQGTTQMKSELADGLAVTINLCTGLSRFNLGRPPVGKMADADVGEKAVPVDLEPGGLMVFGPQLAGDGMTEQIETTAGGVHASLVCADAGATTAEDYLADKPLAITALTAIDVRGKGKLSVKAQRCPVLTIVTPLDNQPATVTIKRPEAEIARSTGGPVLHCAGKPAAPPEVPADPSTR
jgi:hypothetical protein